MKLFNQGTNTIHGATEIVIEGVKKKVPYAFAPKQALDFTEAEATKLKRLYPRQLLSLEDVQSQFANSTAAVAVGAAPEVQAAPVTPPVANKKPANTSVKKPAPAPEPEEDEEPMTAEEKAIMKKLKEEESAAAPKKANK
jgi:hypothetical protein